jgi:hypothetical protein
MPTGQLGLPVRGSVANSGLNSYNNSSDESARGGSTHSLRGR